MTNSDYVVIEIRVQHLDGKEFTKDQLEKANACLNVCCHELEKADTGYISAQLYLGDHSLSSDEIEEME